MEQFIQTNGIQLHLLNYAQGAEPLILMHGLTANAQCFAGLVNAGLAQQVPLILVDLRGRGLSDKPATGYTMHDHAQDILGLLDALGIPSARLGGHSFGGMLSIYLAAHHPERVQRLVLMDAGILHPSVRQLIQPSIDRLGKTIPSWEAYLNAIKASPYFHDGFWADELETYYRADVDTLPDGTVRARSTPEAISQAADDVLAHDWENYMRQATQPALLLHAPEGVGPAGTPPILTDETAQQTVKFLPNCRYERVTGNHVTMVFGPHAAGVVKAIVDFVH